MRRLDRLCLIWPVEGFFKINRARNFEHVRVIFQMATANEKNKTASPPPASYIHELGCLAPAATAVEASSSNFVQNTFV